MLRFRHLANVAHNRLDESGDSARERIDTDQRLKRRHAPIEENGQRAPQALPWYTVRLLALSVVM